MSVEISTLGNGMRVVTHRMAHLETVSLGVWVGSGARHENAPQNGISHLLEHMAFKGTERRSARQIAEEIEQVGGDINAATSVEITSYFVRLLKDDVGLALDILADILQNSKFDVGELEREREVILQEIAATQDSPDEVAYDLANEAAFPDQALGRPILGSNETISALTSDHLRAFLRARYQAPRMVLSAAGAVDHDAIVRHAEALFGSLSGGKSESPAPASYRGGGRWSDKPFEQSHVMFAFEGPSYNAPSAYTAQVLAGILGGGMSSRLFQRVREQHGLCYAIYAFSWGLSDAGVFGVHAATSPELMERLLSMLVDELRQAAAEPPTAREIDRAKSQLKAGLLMSLESSSARAEQMARQLLAFDRLIPADELVQRVEGVSAEDVRGLAENLLSQSQASISVVGAGERSAAYVQMAEDFLQR